MDASHSGTLSLPELYGQEWVLVDIGGDEAVPESLAVTLAFTEAGVSGHSGCNRYFGASKQGEQPGEVSLEPLGGTRMACPQPAMDFESRYLQLLGGVMRFGFLNGQLVLTAPQDNAVNVLLFSSHEP